MTLFSLSEKELNELEAFHRSIPGRKEADRLKAVILLGLGWTAALVAQAVFKDDETVRNYWKRYRAGGVKALIENKYKGSAGYLSESEERLLDKHLQENTYLSVKEIAAYVLKEFKVQYTVSGMTDLLSRLGFTYKKPKVVPGKADREKQEAFIKDYEELKKKKKAEDPVYFMDGTHPLHNASPAYGWIKKGTDKEIKTNSGRRRININGAVNIENMDVAVHYAESINSQSTTALLKKIETSNKKADAVYVIVDNARYYKSELVKKYLETSKIKMIFLPPYSPNLNIIERLWKYFKKNILYNRYYEKFEEFESASKNFFKNIKKHRDNLSSLLTDNFQLFDRPEPKTHS